MSRKSYLSKMKDFKDTITPTLYISLKAKKYPQMLLLDSSNRPRSCSIDGPNGSIVEIDEFHNWTNGNI